jgi:hypothetical protein
LGKTTAARGIADKAIAGRAQGTVPEAAPGPGIDRAVVLVRGIVPEAAPGLVIGRAVVLAPGLVIGRVAAVLALDLLLAQLAVARRIKLVTVVHHRGLPLLKVEDLAAGAETTRDPAARGAALAWAEAVIAGAAVVMAEVVVVAGGAAAAADAAVGVVGAAAVAADAGDKRNSRRGTIL